MGVLHLCLYLFLILLIGLHVLLSLISINKSCLKNQQAQVRTCSVGGLKLDERVLALIVTWILTLRGSNHSVLTKEDLVYIYCIMKKIKINWIHIIKEHMRKSMRLSDYHYPYAVLISKFLLYFEVKLEDVTSELVKSTQEMNNGSLSKMRFTKINGKWVSKDGDHGGSSSAATADFDEEDQAADMIFTMKNNLQPILVLEPVQVIKEMRCLLCLLLKDTW